MMQEHGGLHGALHIPLTVSLAGYRQDQQLQPQVIQITKSEQLQNPDMQQAAQPGSLIQLSTSSVPMQEVETVLEPDKQAIYRHPLFPLMALLFEKCEQATQTPDCPTADSFDVDIQAFVHQQEQERKPFFSDEPELDNLMVKAIQVLRIHLLELEKVNELCKDFCTRYISCLKGKLQSEQLLRSENDCDDSMQFECTSPGADTGASSSIAPVSQQTPAGNVVMQNSAAQPASLNQGQIISGGTVYQMVQTPQGLVAQPIQIQTVPPIQPAVTQASVIHGSTPLSQIGVTSTPSSSTVTSTGPNLQNAFVFEDDDDDPKKKTKRGILPKHATQVMKSWLFQHIVHPYPTEDEKRQIASQTNLSLLQVNNWFINARRRILQPMLDASNPEQAKVKKNRPQNRPLHRFWPDSIANITPQLSTTASSNDQNSVDSSQPGTPTSDTTVGSAAAQLQALSSQAALNQVQQTTQGQMIIPGTTLVTADGHLINTNTPGISVKIDGLSPMLSGQGSSQAILLSSISQGNGNANHGLVLDNSDTGSSLGD
ncbi:homeobox protein PKNOX1-like [Tubulanus polymorphus]|uniref:homeobox protein PKNOX1-like n=1 Tax=Tubulanus polymorphus TaxID=672921 RepID=UPI003DA21B95